MPPAARAATPAQPAPPPPTCGYTVHDDTTCKAAATHTLPAGSAASSDPLLLCDRHAARFLGAAQVLR
jgi:hypothetical protein